jgi:hypothetical protein
MLKKFTISTWAFILCLFGFTLAAVSNVSALEGDSAEILQCTTIGEEGIEFARVKMRMIDCFARVARDLNARIQEVGQGGEERTNNARVAQVRSENQNCTSSYLGAGITRIFIKNEKR